MPRGWPRELEMKRILVPRNPGILCAMGLLLTDLRADFARDAADGGGRGRRCRRIAETFAALAERGRAVVRRGGHRAGRPAPHAHRGHAL